MKNTLKTITVLTLITLLASCDLLFEPPENPASESQTAQITINIGGSGRTILPNITIANYVVNVDGVQMYDGNSASITLTLDYGWRYISVDAQIDNPQNPGSYITLFSKSEGFDVNADTTSIDIIFNDPPAPGGFGTFNFNVIFPTANVYYATIQLNYLNSNSEYTSVMITNDTPDSFNNVPSGIYFVTAYLHDTSYNLLTSRRDVVHIYDQLESELVWSFYGFFGVPEPTDTITVSGNITVTLNGSEPTQAYLFYIKQSSFTTDLSAWEKVDITFSGANNGSGTYEIEFGAAYSSGDVVHLHVNIFEEFYDFGSTTNLTIPGSDNLSHGLGSFTFTTTPLTADTWADDSLSLTVKKWYTVTGADDYYIWLNDRNEGDGTKTLNGAAFIYLENGKKESLISSGDHWSNGVTISSTTGIEGDSFDQYDTLYIQVSGADYNSGGTYGIAYSESNSRPALNYVFANTVDALDPESLNPVAVGFILDSVNSTLSPGGDRWYKVTTASGEKYSFYFEEQGSELSFTVYDKDGDLQTAANPLVFNSTSTDPVYIKVSHDDYQYLSPAIGYTLWYSNLTNIETAVLSVDAVADDWTTEDEFSSTDTEFWYTLDISAISESTVYIWLNDQTTVDSSDSDYDDYVAAVKVDILGEDGTVYYFEEAGANEPLVVTSTEDTLYIRVRPSTDGEDGKFEITYSTDGNRPN